MTKFQHFSVETKENVLKIFSEIDAILEKEKCELSVTVLGGISLIVGKWDIVKQKIEQEISIFLKKVGA